uniref:Type III-B CRISPR module-associated protein Cmr3 n=1 Tax=Fervidicoccus fontis TaxID=683846 RepID=A0A7J3ZK95_9CREN
MWISFKPITPLVLRAPSPLEPGIHGPGVGRGHISYPMPSTLAGALAFVAWSSGARQEAFTTEDYDDTRGCLAKLLGSSFMLRVGLVRVEGRTRAYIGTGAFPETSRLLDLLAGLARSWQKSGGSVAAGLLVRELLKRASESAWRPPSVARTGIALNRSRKSVVEGMLYTNVEIDYRGSSILVYAYVSETTGPGTRHLVKLGGEGGIALLEIPASNPPEPFCELACKAGDSVNALMLISPALLDGGLHEGAAVISSDALATSMAERLLSGYACAGYSKVVAIPKGELEPLVTLPGWSLASNRPRAPMQLVPAGLVLVTESESRCVAEIVRRGVGLHSDLGWGTVVAAGVKE